jgi:hypothetical protein
VPIAATVTIELEVSGPMPGTVGQSRMVVLVRVKCWERSLNLGSKLPTSIASQRAGDCARQQARPDRLGGSQQGARLRGEGVKAQPGSCRARRQDSTTAGLDGPLRAPRLRTQAGTKERPPRPNKGTARSEELSRCRNQFLLPAEVCERMRRRRKIGSSRRMRTLVTRMARSRPFR